MNREITKIASIEEAIELLQPIDVEYYHLSATVDESGQQPDDDSEDDEQAQVHVATARRVGESGVDYRCRLTVQIRGAEIVVDGAILYRADSEIEVARSVCEQFGDDIAVMALFPYLRQAVSDLADRIGRTVTLPLVRRGQIRFSQE